MSELKPCPFCGSTDVHTSPNGENYAYVYCNTCGAEGPTNDIGSVVMTWNRRAQTAQAVPASCGECGKKTSDGWALYCVACMEKAGLPAVTDSPPLMHSCTSSLGKTPDSTAQAVPLLSEQEVVDLCDGTLTTWGQVWLARRVEQAVRAKMGVGV